MDEPKLIPWDLIPLVPHYQMDRLVIPDKLEQMLGQFTITTKDLAMNGPKRGPPRPLDFWGDWDMNMAPPRVLTAEEENKLKNQFIDDMEAAIKSDAPRIIIDSYVPPKEEES